MKQKKTITVVLLIAVICIWGYVIMQFINGVHSSETETEEGIAIAQSSNLIKIDHNLTLRLNYPDPFLKSFNTMTSLTTITKPKKSTNTIKIQPINQTSTNVIWPEVSFKGLIKNQNHPEKTLGLIVINKSEHIVRKNDRINELIILNINKNSIDIQLEKETRTFKK